MIALLFGGLAFTLLVILAYLILIFVLISLPVYLASKIIVPGKSELLRATAATFLAVIVFLFLAFLFGLLFLPLGIIAGFLGVLFVLSVIYSVGLVKAIGLAIIAFLMILILSAILAFLGLAIVHL
ncbi:MAG: hypothetical protein ACP5UZ_08840 [Thermoplasmata archaeon]